MNVFTIQGGSVVNPYLLGMLCSHGVLKDILTFKTVTSHKDRDKDITGSRYF